MGTSMVFHTKTGTGISVFADILMLFGECMADRLQSEFESILCTEGVDDLESAAVSACKSLFEDIELEDMFGE